MLKLPEPMISSSYFCLTMLYWTWNTQNGRILYRSKIFK